MSTSKTQTVESIYHALEREIVDLELAPGAVLSENSLCKRFGVSRTPIRSALQRLEQNRFVVIVPQKGTIVTPIDLEIVHQLTYRRVALESMVLRDFIRSATAFQIEQIRLQLACLTAAAEGHDKLDDHNWTNFLRQDLKMHEMFFRFTGKQFLWEDMARPQADYSRMIRLDIFGAKNVPDVLKEHNEIMRIIDEKDYDAIEPLLTYHFYGGIRRLSGILATEKYRTYFKGTP